MFQTILEAKANRVGFSVSRVLVVLSHRSAASTEAKPPKIEHENSAKNVREPMSDFGHSSHSLYSKHVPHVQKNGP